MVDPRKSSTRWPTSHGESRRTRTTRIARRSTGWHPPTVNEAHNLPKNVSSSPFGHLLISPVTGEEWADRSCSARPPESGRLFRSATRSPYPLDTAARRENSLSVQTLKLPPEGYSRGPRRDQWGAWQEVWIAPDPPLSFEVRPGWVVQIGSGPIGREAPIFEEPNHGVIHTFETADMVRLAFRARKVDPDTTGKRKRLRGRSA